MSFRSFIDSTGHEWQVYDVVPRRDERRHYDRRTSGSAEAGAPEPADRDRREEENRRLSVGRQSPLAPVREGWLCFERGEERRRLSPIPDGWPACSESELERYREAARPVRPLRASRAAAAVETPVRPEPKP